MNLKNYTSEVPVDRTVLNIERIITGMKASHVAKQFDDAGRVIAIQFMIEHGGKKHVISLPANPDAVFEVMRKQFPQRNVVALRQQSDRTAWKLMRDWIEVQQSLIQTKQAEVLQVFLPYVWDGQRTYYECLRGNNFKQLTNGSQD